MAIGRISGPLLKANLIRDGVDLAFETDLLYLDVNNSRIGINSASPQYDLDVVGTTRTSNLYVGNQVDVGNFSITGNTISSDLPVINFIASGGEATAYHSRLIVNDIELNNNVISTTVTNTNLEIRPNGTGIVDIQSSTNITGNLDVSGNITATGDITIGGNLIIGDSISDTIEINASIKSNLVPETDNLYNLGSSSFKWNSIYANTIHSSNLSLTSFDVGDIRFTDNTISTVNSQNLVLDANGSGVVRIGNFAISDNTITNVVTDSVTEIAHTGTGYLKISGTNGFVPPRGDTASRPWSSPGVGTIEGMLRYNTDSKALELWDGSVWASPAGTIGAVSEGTAIEIAIHYALTVG